MIVSTLPVRRRTRAERTVLTYLRGHAHTRLTRDLDIHFRRLRQIAARVGFDIMPAGSSYVTQSELTLLCWIAAATARTDP